MAGIDNVLTEFLELLVGGIETVATGIGAGVNEYVTTLFFRVTEVDGVQTIQGLSEFGGVVAIFGGIALALGLTTLIFNWIRSIGN